MKDLLTIPIVLAMLVAVLTGCSGKDGAETAKTPEELTQLYADAIAQNGGEMVEYNPVISEEKEDDSSSLVLETLGLQTDDMQAFGISASMMNVQAYGIAAIMPADGKTEAVQEALQGFIDCQRQSFEQYLADQYEVAKNARLETLEDGTILMVMCQDQDAVFDAISTAILAG
ncbi:MAG: DUF4358 domain-containing protein [Lawsonibacter sp.]